MNCTVTARQMQSSRIRQEMTQSKAQQVTVCVTDPAGHGVCHRPGRSRCVSETQQVTVCVTDPS